MIELKLKHELNNYQLSINIKDTTPKIYAIKGRSGRGKTTILNIIACLKRANACYLNLNNRTLTDTENNKEVKIQKRNIGYLFQDYQLFPNMTVYQNITFMAQHSDHIENIMHQLNIAELSEQYPRQLSGGESQRVALARTLSTKPDLVLLDEPFSSLDDDTKDESISLVRNIFEQWQIPIIFVTHSKFEAQSLAHEIIDLEVSR